MIVLTKPKPYHVEAHNMMNYNYKKYKNKKKTEAKAIVTYFVKKTAT